MSHDFQAIERRWQRYWAQHKTFAAPNPGDEGFDPARPKFYVLDMFPYPSGVGLHVGHPLGYIATDIVARYKRATGHNVLHPMGYDAFGLPAEQYAIETGVHPRTTTEKNIANMTRQLQRLGLGYDWDRALATTDPGYTKWTQWIFLQLFHSWFDPAANAARPIADLVAALEGEDYFIDVSGNLVAAGIDEDMEAIGGLRVGLRRWHELDADQQRNLIHEHRLAYLAEAAVNWCPALGTVLANEEVTAEGLSERGNHPVVRRPLKQWMLRITKYADRLADELDAVDWPEPIKQLQRNWIGSSMGASVDFALEGPSDQGNEGPRGGDEAKGQQADTLDPSVPRSLGPSDENITVFTTRPDTLFGATYMVLAPEHPLVDAITTADRYHAVNQYRNQAAHKSDIDRQAETREKTGEFTGAYAINPVNDERLPIWIADYVMMGYAAGAIMAVPAHDRRDFDFAKTFGLPIRPVVRPSDAWLKDNAPSDSHQPSAISHYLADPASFGAAYTGSGEAINSANAEVSLNGMNTADAKAAITDWLHAKALGSPSVQYKLRDWLFSRQRYWGEPFPILHGPKGEIVGVPEDQLPVTLPEIADFKPQPDPSGDTSGAPGGAPGGASGGAPPRPPLAGAPQSWKQVEIGGVTYTREFNTMPQWAGSCWYYLRFLDPHNAERFVGEDAERYWMGAGKGPRGQGGRRDQATKGTRDQGKKTKPGSDESTPSAPRSLDPSAPSPGGVDLYVGGVEHAVLHLLYARFWHKVLYDLGHVSTPEPFGKLFNQGYIQAYAYTDARGMYVPAEEVEERDGGFFHRGEAVTREFGKMGKSLKNAISPDEMCKQYGCDTLRLYEMYLGPLEQSKVWNTRDIIGVHRFLQRLWRNLVEDDTEEALIAEAPPSRELARLTHQTIKRVSEAMERMHFNVAIAAMIELNNALVPLGKAPRFVAESLVVLLAPFAPHIGEELWEKLGHAPSVVDAPWPSWDQQALASEVVEYPVQVNGKLRSRITVAVDADRAAIEAAARADDKAAAALSGMEVKKVIVVPGRLVNFVAK